MLELITEKVSKYIQKNNDEPNAILIPLFMYENISEEYERNILRYQYFKQPEKFPIDENYFNNCQTRICNLVAIPHMGEELIPIKLAKGVSVKCTDRI